VSGLSLGGRIEEYFIHLSHRLDYLDDAERERLAARALQGLIRYWEGEAASGRVEIDRS